MRRTIYSIVLPLLGTTRPLVVLILVMCPLSAHAVPLLFSGSFSGTGDGSSSVNAISGSWSFVFDNAVVPALGNFNPDVSLSTLSVTPSPLGATIFDTSNAFARLAYLDGSLVRFFVGGSISGPNGLNSNADDFSVQYSPPSGADLVGWGLASEAFTVVWDRAPSGSFQITPISVPEPTTLTLFGIGLAGVTISRRRKARV